MGGSGRTSRDDRRVLPPAVRPRRKAWRRLILLCATACAPAQPAGPPGEESCTPPPDRPGGLLIAGSGGCLAFARAVADRFAADHPRGAATVAASIGTAGAVRALADGAIDVGLASRALRDDESALGIEAVPWVRAPFGAVAHRRSPVPPSLSPADIAALLRGERLAWGDGTPVVVLLRERGDSGEDLLRAWSPEVGAAWRDALDAGRWPVLATDQEMRDAVVSGEGALGFLDVGAIRLEDLPLRVVAAVGDKPLSLLLGPSTLPLGREFAAYATSPAVDLVRQVAGYLPP